ncbi:hypothetical protein [Stutzerimonas stutzeri]|uniref:hypothetical protein n=1 Tax=Stutzerimonas stutzeri TaxID=316 RepID=UPI003D0243DC
MRKAIDQDTLEALISTGAMREFRVVRHHGAWALQGRLGASWLPVRSRREPVRAWASLTAVGRFAEAQGIKSLIVEL